MKHGLKLIIVLCLLAATSLTLAQDSETFDPRADAISNAVAQYGVEDVSFDPRAQAISDAIAQYGVEPPFDPRAQAISDAVAQYGREQDTPIDPVAEAIGDAVQSYNEQAGDPPLTGRQAIRGTRDGAERYNANRGTRREIPVELLTDMLIDQLREEALVPTNGYWRRVGSSTTSSDGQCRAEAVAHGDGMGGDVELPQEEICGFKDEPISSAPYMTFNGTRYDYIPGTESLYIKSYTSTELDMDTMGRTTGSYAVTHDSVIRVLGPTLIEITHTSFEEGGCTRQSVQTYELVTANNAICVPVDDPIIIEATEEPSSTGGLPVAPPTGVEEGTYTTVVEQTPGGMSVCNDKNAPPTGDYTLTKNADQSVTLTAGAQSYTLFSSGGDLYQFTSGVNAQGFQTLMLMPMGDHLELQWMSIDNSSGATCMAVIKLYGAGVAVPMSTPQPNGEAADTSIGGSYTVAWLPSTVRCDAAPTFGTLTLSEPASGSITLTYDGGNLTLNEQYGMYMYSGMDANGGLVNVMLGQSVPGAWSLLWNVTSADYTTMCDASANLLKLG